MSKITNVKKVVWSTEFEDVNEYGQFKKYATFEFRDEGELIRGIIVAIGREESEEVKYTVLQVVVDIRSMYLIKIQD